MTTPFHSKYWANKLTLRAAAGSIESLSRSIAGARVDLNPHQVDAALFALRSPLARGVILADEVGLGKTIEAGIVIAQRWAERNRKRRELFDAQDAIDTQRDELIKRIEGQLCQRHTLKPLFTFRWRLA